MRADASFIRQLKKIDKGLSVVFNSLLERFMILWKDPVTKEKRIVITIEEDDGAFRPCDTRALLYCSQVVDWEALHKYPNPIDWYADYVTRKKRAQEKHRADRNAERLYWNKHHRGLWKSAFENARSGRMGFVKPEDKRIQVQVPRWAEKEGLTLAKGGPQHESPKPHRV